jgi:hypothetical protein
VVIMKNGVILHVEYYLTAVLLTSAYLITSGRTDCGKQTNKQTPWPLVCKRTIPTERPPLVNEI